MMTTQKRISKILYSLPIFILMVPLVAMQFTKEVNWTLSDFLIMGILLFATVFTIDFVLKKVKTFKSRLILVFGILALLILIWAELAVGIFGSPFAGS
jgi:hypothetical protein